MANSSLTGTVAGIADGTSAGLLSATTQTIGGVKTFNSPPVISDASGIVAASASVPGVVTTGTQTLAGAKTLTGLITATSGIFNTGLTGSNATAVSTAGSGQVGETIVSTSTLPTPAINGTRQNVMQITLNSGIWLIIGAVSLNASGATWGSAGYLVSAISTVSASEEFSNTYGKHGINGRIGYQCSEVKTIISNGTVIYLVSRNDLTVLGTSVYDPSSSNTFLRATRIA